MKEELKLIYLFFEVCILRSDDWMDLYGKIGYEVEIDIGST